MFEVKVNEVSAMVRAETFFEEEAEISCHKGFEV